MSDFPRITVVTPSYNQAEFLERTICSVVDQKYPNLEYIIVDGGSTDGSVDIIRKYSSYLSWWVSEPDNGQADAINKGLARATGNWIAWQNSDDIYYPGTFFDLARMAAKFPSAGLIIGNMMLIGSDDRPVRDMKYIKPTYKALLAEGMLLANQAAFWRKDLQDKIGLLDESYSCSFDYDWFLRLAKLGEGAHSDSTWGALRLHDQTKTSNQTELFTAQNNLILAGRELPSWQQLLYRIRRFGLLLGGGHFRYVYRGLVRRCKGLSGDHS